MAPRLTTKQATFFMALVSISLLFFLASQYCFLINPLLRPLGLSLLQRLYVALRFLLVTTTITLGILNSNRLSSSSSSSSDKKLTANYSMKEADDQSGSSWKEAREIFSGDDPNILSMDDISSAQESEKKDQTVIRSPVVEESVKGDLGSDTDKGLIKKDGIRDRGRASSLPTLAKEQAIAASVGALNNKHRHRRSSSDLTEAINEDKRLLQGMRHHGAVNAVAYNKSIAAAAIPQNITAAPAVTAHKIDHLAESRAEARKPAVAKIGLAASKAHNRSRSAFDLNQFILSDGTDDNHINACKPSTAVDSSTIAGRRRRRTSSLSCDFETNYIDRTSWLCDVPSPPRPPISDIQDQGLLALGASSSSSASKADYCDSLVPWRAPSAAIAIPKTTSSTADPRMTVSPMPELQEGSSSLASSPSSPSLNARLTKKADDFIARFHERMRLQRLESFERRKRSLQQQQQQQHKQRP